MLSPFPGMDPYLEGTLWSAFHTQFSHEIIRQLSSQILPKYVTLPAKQFVMQDMDELVVFYQKIVSDISIVEKQDSDSPIPSIREEIPQTNLNAPLQLETAISVSLPKIILEIRDTDEQELVTVIELLSPINKREMGYDDYVQKRTQILRSPAHLLEIDLLRHGRRVPMFEALPDASYFVFLSRAKHRPFTDVWPIQLTEKLPTIPIPLLNQDEDAILDLQAAFDAVYSLGYRYTIDYSKPTKPPMNDKMATWLEQRLAESL
ncbi:MAG: DUF4058 family protein [Chloroflexota bacterium]